MGGVVPEEYRKENRKEIPKTSIHVWYWFIRLHNRRRLNDSSINPFTYSDIDSFCRLNKINIQSWELQLIEGLDNIALENFRKSQDKQRAASKNASK